MDPAGSPLRSASGTSAIHAKALGAFSVHTYNLPDVAGGLGLKLIGLGVIGALAIVAVAWYLRRRGGRRKVPDETSDATPRRPRRRTKRKR